MNATERIIYGCSDLRKIIPFDCCACCHDEWDNKSDEPNWITINGNEYAVCCTGLAAYKKGNHV